jgi:hypothetical protein
LIRKLVLREDGDRGETHGKALEEYGSDGKNNKNKEKK